MADESEKIAIRLADGALEELLKEQEKNPRPIISDDSAEGQLLNKIMNGEEFLPDIRYSHIPNPPKFDPLDFFPPKPAAPVQAPKERLARKDQLAKERCQAVAKLKWKENPKYTIAELTAHPDIYNTDITGGGHYDPRTLASWLAEVDPRKDKPGRPAKALKKK